MKAFQVASVLAFAAQVLGHGYIYRVTSDNTVYPGYDIFIDPALSPAPSRIAYGGGSTGPVFDATSAAMACNTVHNPAPGFIAQARAGSNVTFHWSRWLYSHKGPITAWMAPYEGDVAAVDVNKLKFVKFAEEAIGADGVWGTVKLLDKTNGTWTATIPADIKPGKYIIRHEIIALHFAINTTHGFEWSPISPQFYMTCFNFNITGSGTAMPQGHAFPGAYDAADPALHWNLSSPDPYPLAGPKVYVPAYRADDLVPNKLTTISPTLDEAGDKAYYEAQYKTLEAQGGVTAYFDSIGG